MISVSLILSGIPNDALALRPISYQASLRSDTNGATLFGLNEGLLELDRMIREKLAEAKTSEKQTVVVAIDGRPGLDAECCA